MSALSGDINNGSTPLKLRPPEYKDVQLYTATVPVTPLTSMPFNPALVTWHDCIRILPLTSDDDAIMPFAAAEFTIQLIIFILLREFSNL